MPAVVVTANTEGETAFETPIIRVGKILGIIINNQSANDITISITDKFTPSPTVTNPFPTEKEVTKFEVTIPSGQYETFNLSRSPIKILGTCRVVASATDTACKIAIIYSFELI